MLPRDIIDIWLLSGYQGNRVEVHEGQILLEKGNESCYINSLPRLSWAKLFTSSQVRFPVSKMVIIIIPCRALWGSWHRAFLCPSFIDYRKQPSFSLHDLPGVPNGRFKQLLIREGRRCETREKQSREPWDKVLCPHQWIHTTLSLSSSADTETPSRWEKCCP